MDQLAGNVFAPNNMVVSTSNIAFYIAVQCLFFWFIASKQFNNVLRDKANIVAEYIKNDPLARDQYDRFRQSGKPSSVRELARAQAKQRSRDNMNLMGKWVGIPMILTLVFLVYFAYKSSMGPIDKALLGCVVGAYGTEILFYFGVIRMYQFYGDQQIYSNLYQGLVGNIDTEPVTLQGQRYKRVLDAILAEARALNVQNDTTQLKRLYSRHRDKLRGISEDYMITYINAMDRVGDFVDLSVLDGISGIDRQVPAEAGSTETGGAEADVVTDTQE
jgi:hypothetical protein